MVKRNSWARRGRPAVLALAAALAASVPAPAPAESSAPRRLTFAQVVDIAAATSPDLVIARTAVTASEHRVAATKSRRYPGVSVEGQVIRWNEPLVFELSVPGMETDPGAPTTTIRDQYTATVTARAVQPLSGLLVISKLVAAERAGLRAARADVEVARLDVIAHAANSFLGALQARALRDIAREAVAQLDAQIVQARALASVGSLDDVDVMRLDAARAAAEQDLANVEAAVRNADEGLLLVLGLPLDAELDPVDDFPDALPALAVDEDGAVAIALGRPSLRAADERAVQARGARDLAKARMVPSINAVAQVDHTEGQGTFNPSDSWFLGVTLSWDVWDWGVNYNDMKAADAQIRGARLSARRARDRVRLEVRSAVRGARAAYTALDAARRGAEVAEEAYRIQSVRFEEGALTTTDLLAAQVDVTRARGALALARFEYLSALVTLRRAMGQAPQLAATPPSEDSK